MLAIPQHILKLRFAFAAVSRHFTTSVDVGEVEHHNKFANDWWDKSWGPMRALHAMNDLRMQFIRTGLINVKKLAEDDYYKPNYLKNIKILDVGCGGGILTIPLARLGADITGLDASPELIEVAKNYASKHLKPECTVQFVTSSVEDYSLTNKDQYDVVILSEVLEHVSMKEMFLHACIDSLKPGGSIFVTTINRTNASWLGVIILAENLLSIVPKGNHEWTKLVTPNELRNYLMNAGCKILQMNGMIYIPYRNVWCWFPDKSVNYAVHAIKQI